MMTFNFGKRAAEPLTYGEVPGELKIKPFYNIVLVRDEKQIGFSISAEIR